MILLPQWYKFSYRPYTQNAIELTWLLYDVGGFVVDLSCFAATRGVNVIWAYLALYKPSGQVAGHTPLPSGNDGLGEYFRNW